MDKACLALLITRIIQALIGTTVLALSISLHKNLAFIDFNCFDFDDRQSCTILTKNLTSAFIFYAFVGAFTLLDAIIGLVSAFTKKIAWLIVVGFDVLAAVLGSVGGVKLAVQWARKKYRPCGDLPGWEGALPPCERYTSEIAILLAGVIATLIALGLVFVYRKSRKAASPAPVSRGA